MIANEIFVCGSDLLSHPVSFLFHFPAGAADGEPTPSAVGKRLLVLADCRSHAASQVATWVEQGLGQNRPVLLLCPSADNLSALEGTVGILPATPAAAMLIAAHKNDSGLTNFDVSLLQYSLMPSGEETWSGPTAAAKDGQPPADNDGQGDCVCTDFEQLSRMFVHPEAADAFKMQVELAMDSKTATAAPMDSPPTGLKYFMHVINWLTSFTYSTKGGKNGPATVTFTWTVWGFLNQTQQSNSQYLSVEGRISLGAGKLYANNECARGNGTARLKGTLTAPMSPQGTAPNGGSGTFSGTVSIPISYKSPTGGYLIWIYTASVNDSVSSWSCTPINSGASLGLRWWMTSPCNGSEIGDTWSDAFTTWGHVNELTGASSRSLNVHSVSAWNSQTLLSGFQTVTSQFYWLGCAFWGSNCSPGVYWRQNVSTELWGWDPSFRVDFRPINPS